MPTSRPLLRSGELRLPRELFDAMGRPRRLAIRDADDGRFFVEAATPARRVRGVALRLAQRALRRRIAPHRTARLASAGPNEATFRVDDARLPADASYHVVNYEPRYYFMPADALPEHQSREEAWRSLEDYHEHRPAAQQDEASNRISQWLAHDVLAPLGARSFLEVGCGGGRNLVWLHRERPDATLAGLEIHPGAVRAAREALGPAATIHEGSLYDLEKLVPDRYDVVLSVATLELVPHDRIDDVLRAMMARAGRALVLLEVHGPAHGFDYHRYPRDYAAIMRRLAPEARLEYTVYPRRDFRSRRASSFHYALLVAHLRG
jgi:SAM-dependent methyltransferase